jgi:pentafunctional AROM polypeptide
VPAQLLQQPSFGGASVTIPHKEAIIPFVDVMTDAASAIGAVNTLVMRGDTCVGYNTDWLGIRNTLEEKLSGIGPLGDDEPSRRKIALVIGAGGTARAACYCVNQLNMVLYIHNRTTEKGEQLASEFHGSHVVDLKTLDKVDVILCTVPSTSHFTVPPHLLSSKPVVLDAAYRPRRTALLSQAAEAGCPVIEGIDMLLAQGYEQFLLFTGHAAPKGIMSKAVREAYDG